MEKSSTRATPFMAVAATLAHLLAISILVLVLVWVLHFREGLAFRTHIKPKIFNVHPLLMVGFILLSGEAILVQKTLPGTKRVQKGTHLALHLSALISGAIGVYAVLKFHDELSIPHVYSLHSWLGLITISLYFLQWFWSFFAFAYPQLKSSTRSGIMPWHVVGGMLLFLMAVSTAFVGLGEKFIFLKLQRGQEALVMNFTGLLLLLFAAMVVIKVLVPRVAYQSS
ncbi:hypothetical protein V2J09_001687 [Rumex salicifolius]